MHDDFCETYEETTRETKCDCRLIQLIRKDEREKIARQIAAIELEESISNALGVKMMAMAIARGEG